MKMLNNKELLGRVIGSKLVIEMNINGFVVFF